VCYSLWYNAPTMLPATGIVIVLYELQGVGSVLQFWDSVLIVLPQIFSVILSNQ